MGCFKSKPSLDPTGVVPAKSNPSRLSAPEIVDPVNDNLLFGKSNFIAGNRGLIDDFYLIEKRDIGKGSYGSVRRAKNRSTGLLRAVKAILKKRLHDPACLAREIDIMKSLDHPNVIKLYETFEDNRYVYLVMELCTGGELFDRIIDAGNFTEKKAAHIVKQILACVTYLHSQGIAHRSLNIHIYMYVEI